MPILLLIVSSLLLSNFSFGATELQRLVDKYNSHKTLKECLAGIKMFDNEFIQDVKKNTGILDQEKLPSIRLDGQDIILNEYPWVKYRIDFSAREFTVFIRDEFVIIPDSMALEEAQLKIQHIIPKTKFSLLELIIPSAEASSMWSAPGELAIRGFKGLAAIAKSAWTYHDDLVELLKSSAKGCEELDKIPNLPVKDMKNFLDKTSLIEVESYICNPKDFKYSKTHCEQREIVLECRARYFQRSSLTDNSLRSVKEINNKADSQKNTRRSATDQ